MSRVDVTFNTDDGRAVLAVDGQPVAYDEMYLSVYEEDGEPRGYFSYEIVATDGDGLQKRTRYTYMPKEDGPTSGRTLASRLAALAQRVKEVFSGAKRPEPGENGWIVEEIGAESRLQSDINAFLGRADE